MREVKESLFSKENILNDKIKTEFQLFEWGNECRKLQHRINQQKYEDQIALAKVTQQIEKEYDDSLDKFKQQAKSDANRSKCRTTDIRRHIRDWKQDPPGEPQADAADDVAAVLNRPNQKGDCQPSRAEQEL